MAYLPSFTCGNASKLTIASSPFAGVVRWLTGMILLAHDSRYKAWRMIWMQPFCAVLFTAGYALREYGAFNYMYRKDSPNLLIFIVSQVFIYVCPYVSEATDAHLRLANHFLFDRIPGPCSSFPTTTSWVASSTMPRISHLSLPAASSPSSVASWHSSKP